MKLSIVSNFLNKEITSKELKDIIKNEITQYKNKLSIVGGSTPILLFEDLPSLNIDVENINHLCGSYLRAELNEIELNYIAEALILSSKVKFENSRVEDALLMLTEIDYFKLISFSYVNQVREKLNI
jgi:hypothetical protein